MFESEMCVICSVYNYLSKTMPWKMITEERRVLDGYKDKGFKELQERLVCGSNYHDIGGWNVG